MELQGETVILPVEEEAYCERHLNFGKLYYCVHIIGQKVMCDILRAVWTKENLGEETVTLRDYCKNKLGWVKKDFKNRISKLHQEYLDKEMMTEEYDISFACRIMQIILNHVTSHLGLDFEEQLDTLKNYRNVSCHSYQLNFNLEAKIGELKDIFKILYNSVGEYLEISFSHNIEEMEFRLTEVLSENFVVNPKAYKENDVSRIIIDGRIQLEDRYSKLRILNPCTWYFKENKIQGYTVDKIFTPLKLGGRIAIELENLLIVKQHRSDKIPAVMILTGLAGSGKSSLCRYLIYEWVNRKNKVKMLNSFDLVFLIEIRRVRSQKIVEFLREESIFKASGISSEDIIPILQELNVLFVIDGYDECRDIGRSLVDDIFAKFSEKRFVITTRPDFYDNLEIVSRRYAEFQKVEVCGFDDKLRREFTVKVFNEIEANKRKCKEEIKHFLDYIDDRGRVLDEHLKLPLTLALLIYLWKESPQVVNNVTSATTLYVELFKLCRNKLAERLRLHSAGIGKLDKLVYYLGEQAWVMLKDARNIISKEIYELIEDKCKDVGIDVVEFLSAFLMCSLDENSISEDRVYEFLHKTQMEYLAAEFLAGEIKKKRKTLMDIRRGIRDNQWQHYSEVLRYLTGHLALQRNPDMLGPNFAELSNLFSLAGINKDNYNYWWNIVVESHNNAMVCRTIALDKLPYHDWSLNAKHVVSGLRLLCDTPVTLETLKIDISVDAEPYDIKYFRETMRNIRNKICSRHNKKNPILVELHFWRHDAFGHEKASDEFLRTLNPWGHLINFTGGLGEQEEGREVLAFCFKLRNIRARVCSPKAIACLNVSLGKLKKIRQIRLTLAVPVTQDPRNLEYLRFNGPLELTLMDIKDENKEWLVKTVRQLGNQSGCSRLCLLRSEVSITGIKWIVQNLQGLHLEKVSVESVNEPNQSQKNNVKELLRNEFYVEVNWL